MTSYSQNTIKFINANYSIRPGRLCGCNRLSISGMAVDCMFEFVSLSRIISLDELFKLSAVCDDDSKSAVGGCCDKSFSIVERNEVLPSLIEFETLDGDGNDNGTGTSSISPV